MPDTFLPLIISSGQGGGDPEETPHPSRTPTPATTATASATPTPTHTPLPTGSPTSTATATPTAAGTATATPTATPTAGAVSTATPTPSGTRRIAIDPITRIEGHLRVEVQIENGVVTDAWSTGTSFRGMEIILQGQDPRDAWALTQRICGV